MVDTERVKKYLLLGVLGFLFVGTFVAYLVFFAPAFANDSKIVSIRNSYYKQVYDIYTKYSTGRGLDNYTILRTPIRVMHQYDGYAVYGFIGVVESVDWSGANALVKLRSNNGKTYNFQIAKVSPSVNSVRGLDNTGNDTTYSFDGHNPSDRYSLGLRDSRKLSDILKQINNQPNEPINQNASDVLFVMDIGE